MTEEKLIELARSCCTTFLHHGENSHEYAFTPEALAKFVRAVGQREPLTAERLHELFTGITGFYVLPLPNWVGKEAYKFARAVEADHGITNHETDCGACGDGCKSRGSCRLADESPEPHVKESLIVERLATEAAPFCPNCRHTYNHRGRHGECWVECAHKQHGRDSFQNILWVCSSKPLDVAPDWCPLRKGGAA